MDYCQREQILDCRCESTKEREGCPYWRPQPTTGRPAPAPPTPWAYPLPPAPPVQRPPWVDQQVARVGDAATAKQDYAELEARALDALLSNQTCAKLESMLQRIREAKTVAERRDLKRLFYGRLYSTGNRK